MFAKHKNEQMYKIDRAHMVARQENKQKIISLEMLPDVDVEKGSDAANNESIEDEEADIEPVTNQSPSEYVLNDEFIIDGYDETLTATGNTNGGGVDVHKELSDVQCQ